MCYWQAILQEQMKKRLRKLASLHMVERDIILNAFGKVRIQTPCLHESHWFDGFYVQLALLYEVSGCSDIYVFSMESQFVFRNMKPPVLQLGNLYNPRRRCKFIYFLCS